MERFRQWLIETKAQIMKGSYLEGAIDNAIDHWTGLTRFLDDGPALLVKTSRPCGKRSLKMDVTATVAKLVKTGLRAHCLALGGADLTSAAGRMTMGVLNVVAQFERDLLVERTNSGLVRAKAGGERLGRPNALDEAERPPCGKPFRRVPACPQRPSISTPAGRRSCGCRTRPDSR